MIWFVLIYICKFVLTSNHCISLLRTHHVCITALDQNETYAYITHSLTQHNNNQRMYNTLVERCFGTCISSFRSKSLDKYETTCLENCASRYIKMTQRVGLRFAEHQAMQQKRAADAAAAAATK
jgi:import inner membrane translocase subunit TIM9